MFILAFTALEFVLEDLEIENKMEMKIWKI